MIRRLGMVAAVGLVLAAGQSVPSASAAPDHKWMSYPGGIAPGASIAQVRDDHRQLQRCTVGFVAQRGTDRFIVTAGHCNELPNTGYSSSVIYTDATTPKVARVAGRYVASRDRNGVTGGAGFTMPTDMGVIELDPAAKVATPLIAGKYRISEILRQDDLRVGMQLCKYGSTTEMTCGPITDIGTDYATASATSVKGDSGALGFVPKKDGTVAAVGILSSNGGKFYYLTPPLRSMGLSLVSNP